MGTFDYVVATDFDRAWLNFELDLPLKPDKDGRPNAFYIDRPGNPIAELTDALLAPFYRPPKFFFSGHRGCGKSTELLHLLSNPEISRKYWPINFCIREEADIIGIDYRDVLLAIGGRLFREYRKKGGELPEQLLKELDGWKGKVEKQISTILEGRNSRMEVGAGIDAFFVNAGMKMKLEPATGSFKDRGMTMAVTKAVEEGSKAIICASTGNTSAAAAAYAARAGSPASC